MNGARTTFIPPANRLTAARALVYGTLVVGTLDLADAVIFFGLRGARPIRIGQSIAAGLLGRAAFSGGWPTALLGVALHFFIAFCVVATYLLASRRVPLLTDAAVPCGIAYGVVVYAVMNYVVIPLSAASRGAFSWPVFLNGIIIHMLGVGLPASLFARAAVTTRDTPRPTPSA
jgi:hypothetical protein